MPLSRRWVCANRRCDAHTETHATEEDGENAAAAVRRSMPPYWQNPAETAEIISPMPGERDVGCRTGGLAYLLLRNGYGFLVGSQEGSHQPNGPSQFPLAARRVTKYLHPSRGRESVVRRVPRPCNGRSPWQFVVLPHGMPNATESRHSGVLPPAHGPTTRFPAKVVFRTELPKSTRRPRSCGVMPDPGRRRMPRRKRRS